MKLLRETVMEISRKERTVRENCHQGEACTVDEAPKTNSFGMTSYEDQRPRFIIKISSEWDTSEML